MNLKGRENEFRNIAIELIRRFQNDVGEVLILLLFPTINGNNFFVGTSRILHFWSLFGVPFAAC